MASSISIDQFMDRYVSTHNFNYKVLDDGSVDVDGDIDISRFKGSKLPFKFNNVSGYFFATGCKLTTLENFPAFVSGSINISKNKISSLEFLPKCDSTINITSNVIRSLHGCPKTLEYLKCGYNHIVNLEGAPEEVDYFDVGYNIDLRSLKGLPKKISRKFRCDIRSINDPYELRYLLFSDIREIIIDSGSNSFIETAWETIEDYLGKPDKFHLAIEQLLILGEEAGINY